MKYSRKSRSKKNSSKYRKNRKNKKVGKQLKSKILKVIGSTQELKRVTSAINEPQHTNNTASGYMSAGGDLNNYLIQWGIIAGRGHNLNSPYNAGGVPDSTTYSPSQVIVLDPTVTTAMWPSQGSDIINRIGDSIILKRSDIIFHIDQYMNFYDANAHFTNDINLDCPPWVVLTRWEPVGKSLNFIQQCQNTFAYNQTDFMNWHYGMPVDWARQYQVRPVKRKILKFGHMNCAAALNSVGGESGYISYQPGTHSQRVNMGKHYGSKGLKLHFAQNNNTPDFQPFFITIVNMQPSAVSFVLSIRNTFTDP